ncbi:MAG: hypothetical protein EOP02_14910 [Proteobacteria bacterium]|nr:MAG: hypothetical protein EOP02_14910 [Pseudomonadota bacterium]
MSDPVRSICPTGYPVSVSDASSSSSSLRLPSTPVPPDIRLQQLRDSALPPCDHHEFTLPETSAGGPHWLERYHDVPASSYLGHLIYMAKQAPKTVTRELVLGFLNDGHRPVLAREYKGLALFLLSNRLFGALTWLLVHSAPDTLVLDNCKLGNDGAAKIAEWLTTIPFKVRVDLRDNEIGPPGAGLLASALAANTVLELNMGFNPLGEEGVQALCKGLLENTSVLSLDLRHVGARSPGMTAVARVLDSHSSLSMLCVDSNAFDDATAAVFAIALGRSKNLTELQIHLFDASDHALALVGAALKVNIGLKSLSISGALDEPYDLLAHAVADGLVSNQTLTDLDLPADSMSAAGLKSLATAVESNTALRRIRLNLGGYEKTSETGAVDRRIRDKVKANGLIEAAGQALSDLSKMPEWPVQVPDEVGQSIAGFIARIAAGDRKKEAMRAIVRAGPLV